MIQNYSVLGLVLARGYSKRIPGKNIKSLGGKPLIEWTIEAAKQSKTIDRFILSTDDPAIAEIARAAGCEVPFMRPPELAGDSVTDYPVFMHALEWLEKEEGYIPDMVVQLRPTSPLRTAQHIDAAVTLLARNLEADSVRTVMEPEQSPYKMYAIGEDGYLTPLLTIAGQPESFNLPGASLPSAYKHVGYVDVMWRRTLIEKGKMTGEKIVPLIVPEAYSGINTPEDWERYEYLVQKR